jgi:hypothetical protein
MVNENNGKIFNVSARSVNGFSTYTNSHRNFIELSWKQVHGKRVIFHYICLDDERADAVRKALNGTAGDEYSEFSNFLAKMVKPAMKEGASPSSAKDEDMIISPRGARQIKARQDACQHDFVSDGNRNGSVMYERCEKCGITKGAV